MLLVAVSHCVLALVLHVEALILDCLHWHWSQVLRRVFHFSQKYKYFWRIDFSSNWSTRWCFLIIFWSFGTNGKNSSLSHCLIRLPWKRQKRSEREKKRECVWIAKLAKMFFCYNSNQSELKCLLYIHDRGPAQVWKSYRIRRIMEQLWNMLIILTRSINSP